LKLTPSEKGAESYQEPTLDADSHRNHTQITLFSARIVGEPPRAGAAEPLIQAGLLALPDLQRQTGAFLSRI